MSDKRVVIFGDSCLDLYWIGDISGLSAEAPVPVVKQRSTLALPGMAGNVQKLLQDLGGVQVELVQPEQPHFPIKNRLVTSEGTQLARWDCEDWCAPLSELDVDKALSSSPIDALLVSDYGKGTLSAEAIKALRAAAEDGPPVFVDTKGDPFVWIGLPNVTLFPNALEYAQWKAHYDWMPSVVYKHGATGMTYLEYGEVKFSVPSRATQVRNVCGAGDAVIAAFVWSTLRGCTPEHAMDVATDAAAILVGNTFANRNLLPLSQATCN